MLWVWIPLGAELFSSLLYTISNASLIQVSHGGAKNWSSYKNMLCRTARVEASKLYNKVLSKKKYFYSCYVDKVSTTNAKFQLWLNSALSQKLVELILKNKIRHLPQKVLLKNKNKISLGGFWSMEAKPFTSTFINRFYWLLASVQVYLLCVVSGVRVFFHSLVIQQSSRRWPLVLEEV